VGLWVTRSVIQAPRGQREALSIRCGKSIHTPKNAKATEELNALLKAIYKAK
jgi:hypothetical protein